LPSNARSSIIQRPGSSCNHAVVRDSVGTAAESIQAHTLMQDRSQGVAIRPGGQSLNGLR
jgi:hypothetical protein